MVHRCFVSSDVQHNESAALQVMADPHLSNAVFLMLFRVEEKYVSPLLLGELSGNEKPYPWRPQSCEPNNVSSEKEDVLCPPRKKTDQELLAEIVKRMEGTLES